MADALEQVKREAEALAQRSAGGDAPAVTGPGPDTGASLDQAALDRAEAEAWATLPAMFGSILCMALPELREAYSAKNCAAWGEAFVPLAKKHGWTFAKLGPELGVAAASMPMLLPTAVAIQRRRAGAVTPASAAAAASPVPGADAEAAAIAAARERAAARRSDAPAVAV